MQVLAPFAGRLMVALACFFSLVSCGSPGSPASEPLIPLSSDPYINSTSQHHTEVEPDTYAFGSTIVAAFQVGRFANIGGSSNIGWATSTDDGKTWTHGFLPGITVFAGGMNERVTDPSVAYDARHQVWLISSLPINGSAPTGNSGVFVSRSIDGGLTWDNPITVRELTGFPNGADKDWIDCDTTPASPFYGHCYTEWSGHTEVEMSTSTDGGLTWENAQTTADHADVVAGQPLAQPNGTVIVPFLRGFDSIGAFTSTDGGISWSSTVTLAPIFTHQQNTLRGSLPVPSAAVDGFGTVYVVWQDCRFESGCTANDLLMSTSSNGISWTTVQRIPIDPVGSGVDHFIPGLAVDRRTAGNQAHLALAYYYYPLASCTVTTCQLDVGFISSLNGGATWGGKEQLAGPMQLMWLGKSGVSGGIPFFFAGDYISTSFLGASVFPVFAVAQAPSAGQLNEAMVTIPEDV